MLPALEVARLLTEGGVIPGRRQEMFPSNRSLHYVPFSGKYHYHALEPYRVSILGIADHDTFRRIYYSGDRLKMVVNLILAIELVNMDPAQLGAILVNFEDPGSRAKLAEITQICALDIDISASFAKRLAKLVPEGAEVPSTPPVSSTLKDAVLYGDLEGFEEILKEQGLNFSFTKLVCVNFYEFMQRIIAHYGGAASLVKAAKMDKLFIWLLLTGNVSSLSLVSPYFDEDLRNKMIEYAKMQNFEDILALLRST